MVLGDQTPSLLPRSQEPAPPLPEGSVCSAQGSEAGNRPLPCGAASHTPVALPGQPPSLDPGNSDLFKLGTAQLKQTLGTPSRLPSFTCQGSCAFAKHIPGGSQWEQTLPKRLGRSSGSVGVGWDTGLQPCGPPSPPVQARE